MNTIEIEIVYPSKNKYFRVSVFTFSHTLLNQISSLIENINTICECMIILRVAVSALLSVTV